MKEIEAELWKNNKDDYNNILRVYPDCDTNMSKTIKTQADECIKKASLGIDWHGGTYWTRDSWNGESRWADNAFILIGKSRLYLNDMKNARETFKYINTKSKNDNDRHEALIWLANTYTNSNDYFSAAEVLNQLNEERMNNKNKREYFLAKTYFHTRVGEFAHANKYVQKAIPLTSRWVYKRDKRARLHFIAAQIYQMYNRDSSAYLNYQKTIKNNPTYELGFYARLYSAQVSAVGSGKQGKKMQKYFRKMLKDPKNKEYNDKIYYEMANYELKYSRYDKGREYLNKSLKTEIQNPTQKGYTYLKLGELNYEHYKNYKNAKLYYDSALLSLPVTHKDYRKISKRKNILDEFAKYYDIIVLEDSLQKLAKMDTTALRKKIEALIEADYKKQKDEFMAEKRAAQIKADKEAMQKELAGTNFLANDPNAKWYFYNYATVQNGKLEFKKLWGNRVLEDHWRRSTKEKVELNPADLQVDSLTANADKQLENEDPNAPKPDKDGFLGQRLDKTELYSNVPLTPEMMAASDDKIIDAKYHLSKIYHFKLEEINNAVENYLALNKRFPKNEHEAEVLYLLYLIFKENDQSKSEYYKNQLLADHPQSDYAKGLIDPNWREKENFAFRAYQSKYLDVYRVYEAKHYSDADSLAKQAVTESPETPFKGKLELISVLTTARTKNIYEYKAALIEFEKTNKDSTLTEYTQLLIKQCEERIRTKEEIEKKWQQRLDSLEQSKAMVNNKNAKVNNSDSVQSETKTDVPVNLENKMQAQPDSLVAPIPPYEMNMKADSLNDANRGPTQMEIEEMEKAGLPIEQIDLDQLNPKK